MCQQARGDDASLQPGHLPACRTGQALRPPRHGDWSPGALEHHRTSTPPTPSAAARMTAHTSVQRPPTPHTPAAILSHRAGSRGTDGAREQQASLTASPPPCPATTAPAWAWLRQRVRTVPPSTAPYIYQSAARPRYDIARPPASCTVSQCLQSVPQSRRTSATAPPAREPSTHQCIRLPLHPLPSATAQTHPLPRRTRTPGRPLIRVRVDPPA